jgi:hypothetical protein
LAPGEHGYISYSVKPEKSTPSGVTLKNRASIVFDYNLPVVTNYATTDVIVLSGTNGHHFTDNMLNIYPNPGKGTFTIELKNVTGFEMINMIDIRGNILWSGSTRAGQNNYKINVSGLSAGVYTLMFLSGNEVLSKKIEIIH